MDHSPPWHRRPAGGRRRYNRFRPPSLNEGPNYEAEFTERGKDEMSMEWAGNRPPFRREADDYFRHGLKQEVLKVSPEVTAENGEVGIFFKAVAIAGDANGNVGLGVDTSLKPTRAARNAIHIAQENMVSIRRGHWGASKMGIPHTIFCKVSSSIGDLHVRVNPAPRGTGITGPILARKLLELAGVQDAYVIVRGEEPDLATLCQAILAAVKDTFTIFQDKILQAYNIRRKEDLVTYSKTNVAEIMPFSQPKGSYGNLGLFTPDMAETPLPPAQPAPSKVPPTFSDFVPGARAHGTQSSMSSLSSSSSSSASSSSSSSSSSKIVYDVNVEEFVPTSKVATISAEDADADARDVASYIEEINQISSQFDSGDARGKMLSGVGSVSGVLDPDSLAFDGIYGYSDYGAGEYDAANFDTGSYDGANFDAANFADVYYGDAGFESQMGGAEDTEPKKESGERRGGYGFHNPYAIPPLVPRQRKPIPIVDPNEVDDDDDDDDEDDDDDSAGSGEVKQIHD